MAQHIPPETPNPDPYYIRGLVWLNTLYRVCPPNRISSFVMDVELLDLWPNAQVMNAILGFVLVTIAGQDV
jgi:hypothetical protein